MPTYLVGPGRTYTTLQAAAAALPTSLPGTGIHRIIMDAGDYVLPTTTISFPSNGDANNYYQIEAAAGAEWAGDPSRGVRLLYSASSDISLEIREFARFLNVALITSGAHSCVISCFQHSLLINVILRTSFGGFADTNQGRCTLINCVAQNDGTLGGFPIGFNFGNGNGTVLYNCGAYGFYQQYQGSLTTKAVNCWAVKNSGSIEFGGFWDPSSSNNASTNTSAPGANSLRSQLLSAFAFTDVANGNFHISISSVLAFAGLSLASVFTTDFDNEDISGAWPIGPDTPQGIATTAMPNVEVIYPVRPDTELNKIITRLDNEEIRVTTKSAAPARKEIDIIRFRIGTSFLGSFLNKLDLYAKSPVPLLTPGYTPFGSNSESNSVRVLNRTSPKREDRGLTQLVDVTFQWLSVYP